MKDGLHEGVRGDADLRADCCGVGAPWYCTEAILGDEAAWYGVANPLTAGTLCMYGEKDVERLSRYEKVSEFSFDCAC